MLRILLLIALTLLPAGRAAADDSVILVLGDSLSSGYGLPAGKGWTDLLGRRLARERLPQRVVNASISGETTAGGAYRVGALLEQHKPAVVIVELGGNDGLRGLSLDASRDNLDRIVRAARAAGARVLVAGMRLPPNYGPAYTKQFESMFAEVAKRHGAALLPFLMEGFGERAEMFQADRIHPTAEAQPLILENVWKHLAPLLRPAVRKR